MTAHVASARPITPPRPTSVSSMDARGDAAAAGARPAGLGRGAGAAFLAMILVEPAGLAAATLVEAPTLADRPTLVLAPTGAGLGTILVPAAALGTILVPWGALGAGAGEGLGTILVPAAGLGAGLGGGGTILVPGFGTILVPGLEAATLGAGADLPPLSPPRPNRASAATAAARPPPTTAGLAAAPPAEAAAAATPGWGAALRPGALFTGASATPDTLL
mmetsp:Transcript_37565/g.94829  ORF Transcript_37565/g.94829 Transcript_37565/m.94829 type:complete len:220 (-) Transcript_37565:262-921(-)